jgi:ATP-dependent DNA ligase
MLNLTQTLLHIQARAQPQQYVVYRSLCLLGHTLVSMLVHRRIYLERIVDTAACSGEVIQYDEYH